MMNVCWQVDGMTTINVTRGPVNDTSVFYNVSAVTTSFPVLDPPPTCGTFRVVYFTALIGALCILGFLGNTISILVLQKDRGNAIAAFLLQALAIADNSVLCISFLVLSVIYGFLPHVLSKGQEITTVAYMIAYGQPCAFMSHTATIWMTVLLALNRYIAICRPFNATSWCTRKKTRLQVALVYGFAFLYNFPRFFQYKLVYRDDLLSNNETCYIAVETSIGETTSLFGQIHTNYVYTFVVVLLPLALIIALNTLIICEMKRMRIRRVSVSSDKPVREENISKVMVVIMIMVVVCHLPDRITFILTKTIGVSSRNRACDKPLYYIIAINNLLVILNSSTNFLVYYILRKSFRRILLHKLCGRAYPAYQLSTTYDDRFTNGSSHMLDRLSIRTRDTYTNININNNHNKKTSGNYILSNI